MSSVVTRRLRGRASLALSAASLAALIAPMAAGQSFSLQHAQSIDLSSQFFGGDIPSDYGANPLSVAFDGTNAYVGGFNSTTLGPGNVGIVRVDNPLSLSPTLVPLSSTVFSAGAARGLDDLASDGSSIYGVYEDGSGAGFVRKYDANGNVQWSVTPNDIVAGYRPSAIAIDPLADNGQPALGMVGIGSGRRAALRLSDGSVVYGPSGAATPPPLGDIVNPNPSSVNGITLGFTYRGLAFDSDGNVAVTGNGGTSYGTRDTQGDTNFNRFVNLDGVASATTPIAAKQLNTGNALFVGQALDFLEGLGGETLLAVNERVGEPFALTLSSAVAGVPQLAGLDSRNVHLLTTTGAVPSGLRNWVLTGGEDGLGAAWTNEVKGIAVGRDANDLPALFVLDFVSRTLDIYNLEPQWNAAAGGTWSDAGNWFLGVVPAGALDNARFGDAITSPATVTVDGAKTVKVLRFDSPHGYTLSGAGSVTLNSPGTPLIDVLQGNHTVGVPVNLAKDAQVNVPTGNTLSVQRFEGAGLAINGGTVRIIPAGTAAGTSRVTSLTLAGDAAPTASLDLSNNAMVVDYSGESPLPTILAQIQSGVSGEGIKSGLGANYAVGYAEASALANVPAIFGSVDADALLLRGTRGGDANLDGLVNLSDFNTLAANFGQGGRDWVRGDFNYDGLVNLTDFNRLAANFGLAASGPEVTPQDWSNLAAAVPEPGMMSLAALAALPLARRRRGGLQ